MRVTAIIPNWNGGARLGRALRSIAGQEGVQFERVIIIDNCSTDDPEALAKEVGAELFRLDRNYGFARAVNEGLSRTGTEWVAILNNDVVLSPNWLAQIASNEQDADFATGKILQLSTKKLQVRIIDGTFDLISRAGMAWRVGSGREDGEVWSRACAIGMAPLTAAVFRRRVFEAAGVLDERYGSYLEDVDLGLRCVNEGFQGRYVPEAVAWHEGGATLGQWSPAMVRLLSRNQVILAKKYLSQQPLWRKVWGQLLWGLLATKRGTGGAWVRGKIDGLHEKINPYPCRQTVIDFVNDSERQIETLQKQCGLDWYWKAYFWLARG